jgi:hypothetical protein
MPVCTINLLSLTPSTTIQTFLSTLHSTSLKPKPLIISKVIRWIILPTSISVPALLAKNIHWDLLLILPSSSPLPPNLQKLTAHQFVIKAGVPSRLLQDFEKKNESLLHPKEGDVPKLTGSLEKPRINDDSAQDLELSPELRNWIEDFSSKEGKGAVSMLNLLAFKPGRKSEYLKYGAEFAKSVGKRRGGNAKIVGSVIHDERGSKGDEGDDGEGWDEISLAHYPSILHFADMLASEDYQEVNHRYRVGSLRDTLILCTSELALEEWKKGLWESKL